MYMMISKKLPEHPLQPKDLPRWEGPQHGVLPIRNHQPNTRTSEQLVSLKQDAHSALCALTAMVTMQLAPSCSPTTCMGQSPEKLTVTLSPYILIQSHGKEQIPS